MSTDLAVYNPPEIDVMDRLDTATIDELTEAFHTELAKAELSTKVSMSHLLRCGEVLHEIRERIPANEWTKWCKENQLDLNWSYKVTRLWVYRDSIDLSTGLTLAGKIRPPSAAAAIRSIEGKPKVSDLSGRSGPHTQETKAVAAKMKGDGATLSEIGTALGVPPGTVGNWLDPGRSLRYAKKAAEKKKMANAARAALAAAEKRAERDALARANGKELSVAYAAVRQALAALAKADRSCDPRALNQADAYLSAAETAIVRALRAERQDH